MTTVISWFRPTTDDGLDQVATTGRPRRAHRSPGVHLPAAQMVVRGARLGRMMGVMVTVGVVLGAVVGTLLVVGLAGLWARHTSRVQARIQGRSPDLRRADDGGDPPYRDVTTRMGP